MKIVNKKPRLREKLQEMGSRNLNNEELLTILLGTGSTKLPVKKLAKQLLLNFPLNKIHLCEPKQLAKQGGIGLAKASKIIAAIEIGRRNALPIIEKVTSPTEALPYLRKIRNKNKEHIMCLYLNASSELIHAEIVSLGGLNYTLLEPRDVFSPAFSLPATAIILAHNHPSGKIDPSLADKKTTIKLVQASNVLGVQLLDHLIVTKQAYFSFKEAGLLNVD